MNEHHMPSQDEIEVLAIFDTTVNDILMLSPDKQQETIAMMEKIPSTFSKIVIQAVLARRQAGKLSELLEQQKESEGRAR